MGQRFCISKKFPQVAVQLYLSHLESEEENLGSRGMLQGSVTRSQGPFLALCLLGTERFHKLGTVYMNARNPGCDQEPHLTRCLETPQMEIRIIVCCTIHCDFSLFPNI